MQETILVVDDNHQMADFMAGVLLHSMGYETVVAYDGKSALELVRKYPIALMVLDLQLPDTNGLEILRQMEREGMNIPTILVTAHGSEEIAVDAFRLGVQDYLIKPIESESLNAAITRALSESRLRREKSQLTARLQEQVSWLTILSKVGQSVTSTLDLDEVLRRIVEAAVLLTRAEEGFLALLDTGSEKLFLRAAKNIDEGRTSTMRLPVTDPLVSRVMKTGAPLRTTQNAEKSPLKVCTGFLVHSLVYAPIIARDRPQGVLSVDNRISRQNFTESDEKLLLALGDYAAIAIENASLYKQAKDDLTERRLAEHALRVSEERYALAVRGANDGIWDWDLKTHQIYYSPRWKSMLGYAENELSNKPEEWFGRVHPEDLERVKLDISAHTKGLTPHFESEHRIRHRNGSYRWVLSRGLAVSEPSGIAWRLAGSMTDITERKYAEEKLLHDAFYDRLTGLPNRALFLDRLRYSLERRKRREDYLFAVLFLDLDRFKDINDSLGHMMGDELLKLAARSLETILRPMDTVARLGGDEFVILLDEISDISDATRVAERVQAQFAASRSLNGYEIFVSASMGIVVSESGYTRPEDMLRDADIAMYRAKALGRARYEVFDPTMRERIMERLSLETDLRQAIEQNQLQIYFQPIVVLRSGRITGFEALVRWHHPTRGLLTPVDFLSIAEDMGLIVAIDRWILRQACLQLREWQGIFRNDPPLTVSVNISGKHIAQADLLDHIRGVLEETQLPSSSLRLEITEGIIMEFNDATTAAISSLRNMGVQIQIDDFGIGYSSLSYLSHFPIGALKIDKSFVQTMVNGGNDLRIVQAIVMLTHGLGISVIAEGVETEAQVAQLKALGCDYGQGLYVSMPKDSTSIKKLLAENYSKTGGLRTIPGL